jgi:hypothetical protein
MNSDPNIMPEINLGLTDRLKDVAGKVGRFLFGTINAEVAYPSEHRTIREPSDGEAYQPELPMDFNEVQLVTSDPERIRELILQARIAREARG